jgi:hypothetical protein
MATLEQLDALIVGNPLLRQRFRAARIRAAWLVVNEDPQTAGHVARLAWANKIIENYEADLDEEYRWLCSNATIQASTSAATDNDLDFVVASFISQWAGV